MQAIIIRGAQYLDRYYKWSSIPDLIPDWHFPAVMKIMMDERNPQKPTGIAFVDGSKVIDLDNLEVVKV